MKRTFTMFEQRDEALYSAPTIEALDIVTEKGFAESVVDSPNNGYEDNDQGSY